MTPKKKKKSLVGWTSVGGEYEPIYWGNYEWHDPFMLCRELETNIFSQRKMAERIKDKGEKVIKVRITIEEID